MPIPETGKAFPPIATTSPKTGTSLPISIKLNSVQNGQSHSQWVFCDRVRARTALSTIYDESGRDDTVIKSTIANKKTVLNEISCFNKFYGVSDNDTGRAAHYLGTCPRGNSFFRMPKIPGEPISKVPEESSKEKNIARANALERMNNRFLDIQLIHGDLHAGNVLFDGEYCRPVDFEAARDADSEAGLEINFLSDAENLLEVARIFCTDDVHRAEQGDDWAPEASTLERLEAAQKSCDEKQENPAELQMKTAEVPPTLLAPSELPAN